MNLLPVVTRELLLGSRRSQTWWLRCISAAAALTLGILLYSAVSSDPVMRGRVMFTGIGILMLVLAMFSGVFLTSDAISSERRSGTLGLLFLTPLRPLDVILGKLATTSLQMSYGLLAIFPLLFLSLLVGGVSGGEAVRLCLVILVALFLSLALGLRVSVQASNSTHAAMATLSALSLIAFLPWVVEAIGKAWFGTGLNLHPLMGFSPVYSYEYAGTAYNTGFTGAVFWRALGLQFGLGSLCVVTACYSLSSRWRQDSTPSQIATQPRPARAQRRQARLSNYLNPYRWLMERQIIGAGWARPLRFAAFCVWLVAAGGLMWGSQLNFGPMLMIAFSSVFALHVLLGLEVAFEATRPLQEQHQSGALEQVLTSPLPPGAIIAGTHAALNRRFVLAIYLVLVANLALWFLLIGRAQVLRLDAPGFFLISAFLLGGGVMSLVNFAALRWIGMMRALLDRTPLQAALRSLLIVHALPWLLFALVFLMMTGINSQGLVATMFWGYFSGAIFFGIWLARRARRHLTRYFKYLATSGR